MQGAGGHRPDKNDSGFGKNKMVAGATGPAGLDEEDAHRRHVYRLLARFLAAPPDGAALTVASGLEGGGSELGQALGALARVARATTPAEARDEYDELFIGLARGELVPYASFYLTGFLHEKPLAAVRQDLARLGIARRPECRDPEDHVASLCEVMAGLVGGEFGDGALRTQQAFFDRHLAPWAPRFFADLERARASRLYGPVGAVGRAFMGIEATTFAMAA
jgi:TorA maturation chaperone TorD